MKAGTRKRITAALAVVVTSTALMLGMPGTASAAPAAVPSLRAFGISGDGTLMATFTTDRPDVLNWVRVITGLSGDTALVGIDFRVQDGLLYGVGNKGGIYTIKTPPATQDVVVTKVSQLQYALHGTQFGVDFNPAADRLRVISDNGQNLRHNLGDHTTIQDVNLTTPPVEGTTKGVTAAAYTNNDLNGATATTLFDINTNSDQVVIQSPANNGTLAPTGSLGLDAQLKAGMDIYSTLSGGRTVDNAAFASLTPSGASTPSLYSVNVFTGEAAFIKQFPLNITDLAISLTGS
ncbi:MULTISPECIES: DUF4394 domain-containing protein [Streptomyces]|uniref:DUF4394 domain-containing protein n=1 Tax=Streptomyces TaxID=1883 RepID=UPI00062C6133|nr:MULTISPECIES: DUF4394 domain-containing protein [Streptomyces]KND46389.1 hypothetical protein IQ64_01555 [Streptomyces stelliscabiei]MDX2516132.1 DUF4394 domain-containing protein [Streptomyces stelliscabiei]MDX2553104.1 DUF4394 domain-containing protein [Streptomyces stelliscabiei]MDX2612092.1 DUF4394 domain-containing protein [Streptomyces stelliscabiei]MDX2636430.1 DUF4394 domain-containing protein [Streptomyces stelliscabiei]